MELAEGESRVVRLNSGPDKNDLPQLGVWGWETEPPTANHNILAANAAQGLNWLLAPYRELHLVHATQKPLAKPVLHIDTVKKEEGDTAAKIAGHADVHGKTTGKVDLVALWTDPEDDVNKDAPGERESHAALGEFNVTSPEVTSVPIAAQPQPGRHQVSQRHLHRARVHPLPRIHASGAVGEARTWMICSARRPRPRSRPGASILRSWP